MANSIIDDTTAIAKRLREITGETTKTKVVKIDSDTLSRRRVGA